MSYAPVLTILDSDLTQAPTSIVVRLEGGPPETDVTFTIDGEPGTAYVATTLSEGALGPLSVPVPESVGAAGTHTLLADVDNVDSSDPSADFVILRDPLPTPGQLAPDADPVDVPDAAVSTSVRRWVVQDLTPGGLGVYIFPANPTSSDPWPFKRTLTPAHTTAVDGRFHISEPIAEVHPFTCKGTSLTQDFVDEMRQWAELNRRFYLIDHRNRAWTVSLAGTDFVPRKRTSGGNDWVHDYTLQFLIYDDEWKEPVT